MDLIVVGVTNSRASFAALDWAAARAHQCGAALRLVTALASPIPLVGPGSGAVVVPDREAITERVSEWHRTLLDGTVASSSMEVDSVVTFGSAAQVLRSSAQDADMLVLGQKGHRRLSHLARRCLGRTPCVVMIIDGERPR